MQLVMCLAELDDDLHHIRESNALAIAACGREVLGDLGPLNLEDPVACPLCVKAVKSLVTS